MIVTGGMHAGTCTKRSIYRTDYEWFGMKMVLFSCQRHGFQIVFLNEQQLRTYMHKYRKTGQINEAS